MEEQSSESFIYVDENDQVWVQVFDRKANEAYRVLCKDVQEAKEVAKGAPKGQRHALAIAQSRLSQG